MLRQLQRRDRSDRNLRGRDRAARAGARRCDRDAPRRSRTCSSPPTTTGGSTAIGCCGAGASRPGSPAPARSPALSQRDMTSFYPALAAARFEFVWSGLMSFLRHHMPAIGQLRRGRLVCDRLRRPRPRPDQHGGAPDRLGDRRKETTAGATSPASACPSRAACWAASRRRCSIGGRSSTPGWDGSRRANRPPSCHQPSSPIEARTTTGARRAGVGSTRSGRPRPYGPARLPTAYPISKSPACGGAIGVKAQRSGLRSISGVPSRQSRPRTRTSAPSIPTRVDERGADRVGPHGRAQREGAARRPVVLGALAHEVAARSVEPVEHLHLTVPGRARRGPHPRARRPRCGRRGRRAGPAAGRRAGRSRACGSAR